MPDKVICGGSFPIPFLSYLSHFTHSTRIQVSENRCLTAQNLTILLPPLFNFCSSSECLAGIRCDRGMKNVELIIIYDFYHATKNIFTRLSNC